MTKISPTSQTKSASSQSVRQKLFKLFKERPIHDEELLVNLGLYIRSGALAKILFLNEIYEKVINIPGIICEFGVWWGQSLVIFENLRAIYEPYNYTRNIVGFDTFTGYPTIGENDQRSTTINEGVYAVSKDYEEYLSELLDYHNDENVMSHIKKQSVIKGDVKETVPRFFHENPQAIVALAYFDMALYEPTKLCLEAIKPRLIKGSLVVFDELNNKDYPGETKAAMEVLNIRDYKISRSKYLPDRTYVTIE